MDVLVEVVQLELASSRRQLATGSLFPELASARSAQTNIHRRLSH